MPALQEPELLPLEAELDELVVVALIVEHCWQSVPQAAEASLALG